MMNKHLIITLLLVVFLFTPLTSSEKGIESITSTDYEDIKLLSISDQLNKTIISGIGFTTDIDVNIIQVKDTIEISSLSKKPSVIFIPADINHKYTVKHHILNLTTLQYSIDKELVIYPESINGAYYIWFNADEWSYYTVDGSLIQVGITDIRLVGDTVQITGDGYDRLVLQADVSQANWWNDKLSGWNQEILSKTGNNQFNVQLGGWDKVTGGAGQIMETSTNNIVIHSKDSYVDFAAVISEINDYRLGYSIDTTNNYFREYGFIIDNDEVSSVDAIFELNTPDHIDHFIVEMHNQTAGAWQEVLNDSIYTAANLIHLNNSSIGLDFALYEGGKRGETVSVLYGNTSKPDKTVSAYYGCEERRLILVTLPADDGADSATSGASQVKIRLTVYYNPEGIIDNSNYTNHGTQSGGVSRVRDGQIGEAVSFDGVDGEINIGKNESLNMSNSNVTIEAIIYLQPHVPASRIIKIEEQITFGVGENNILGGYTYHSGWNGSWAETGYMLSDYTWYKVKMEFNGSYRLYYVDDVLVASILSNGVINGLHGDTKIGYYVTAPFNGIIDEVYVYKGSDLVFHSSMELTPSGAATYEFEDSTNQYHGLDNIDDDTLMLAKAGTQNVTYITNSSDYTITGMCLRADENELIDYLNITFSPIPTNISGLIINQTAIDIDTDSDGNGVPDAFEDTNITANKDQQGGECKWNFVWEGCFNHPNATGYIYYTNLINGSGLVGTEIQTAGTQNMSMNTDGVGEEYNFTIHSGTSNYLNVTANLDTNSVYTLRYQNDTFIEGQSTDANTCINFTTDLTAGTYYIKKSDIVVWLFNSTTGAYSNTTTDSLQPCQGFLAYLTQNMTPWVRNDL